MRKELSKKEIGNLAGKIWKQFAWKLDESLTYLSKDEKERVKIFLYSGLKIPPLPAEWIGLHFGTLIDGEFQPSIDGAGLMKTASENVVEVSRKELEELMKGNAVAYDGKLSGCVIVKSGDLACTGLAQEGKIASTTPKSRRL